MKIQITAAAVLCAAGMATFAAQSQNQPAPQQPASQNPPAPRPPNQNADPYFNNPAAGTQNFPLAAPAGQDSGARNTAPAGAVNQGPFDPATWKYGPAF